MIKMRRMRWAGNVARTGKRIGVYKGFVGRTEKKRPLGIDRRTWDDNINVGHKGVRQFNLAQQRDKWRTLVNVVMNFRFP